MSVRKIVEVEWVDAQSSLDSVYINDIQEIEPFVTKSVGYLVVDKKEHIILGFSDFGDGVIKHYQLIPRNIISKIKILRKGVKANDRT